MVDPSRQENVLTVQFFASDPKWLPRINSYHDIICLRNVEVSDFSYIVRFSNDLMCLLLTSVMCVDRCKNKLLIVLSFMCCFIPYCSLRWWHCELWHFALFFFFSPLLFSKKGYKVSPNQNLIWDIAHILNSILVLCSMALHFHDLAFYSNVVFFRLQPFKKISLPRSIKRDLLLPYLMEDLKQSLLIRLHCHLGGSLMMKKG